MFSVALVAPRLWWHNTSWHPWVGPWVNCLYSNFGQALSSHKTNGASG